MNANAPFIYRNDLIDLPMKNVRAIDITFS